MIRVIYFFMFFISYAHATTNITISGLEAHNQIANSRPLHFGEVEPDWRNEYEEHEDEKP